MSECEVTVTVGLNEEQHRVATRVAEEMELSLDGLFRSILSASLVAMSDLRLDDAPQVPDSVSTRAAHREIRISIDTWYETWYSDVA